MRITGLLLSLCLFAAAAFSQPVAPTRPIAALPSELLPGMEAASVPLSVDISTRAAARQFYRAVYFASDGIPAQWTGSYSTGNAGTTSSVFKDSVALRINWFRAMAGIPAGITFNSTYSAKAQQAALMMSVNDDLKHFPPEKWTFYTAAGAEAAANSNLTLGDYGPSSVTSLMADDGDDNTAAGHRRWFLYPQTQVMGTGDVPGGTVGGTTYRPAEAVWVFDDNLGATRPATRDSFVSWPPKGYVPYNLIFPRWSFSYPAADFSSATVSVTRNGSPVSVTTEVLDNRYGENTLVWFTNGVFSGTLARPAADVPYVVTLSNVILGATARTFTYTVTAFDPDVQGAGETSVSISGPSSIAASVASTFTVTAPSFADSLQWRILSTAAQSTVFGAEGGLEGLVASISDTYSARVTNSMRSGLAAYYLTMPLALPQYLTLPDSYYVPSTGSPSFNFYSRLGIATPDQQAHLQISLDDGNSWIDIWTQNGAGSVGEPVYSLKSVSLAAYAGRIARFRFSYTVTAGASYYFQTTTNVGWLIDDISLPSLQLASALSTPQSVTGTSFSLTQATVGTFLLQGRGLFSGLYPMEWGTAKLITVGGAITSASSTTFGLGTAGSFTVTAGGITAPTFSATGLPSWATLNATTGVISGTPTSASGSPFTLTLTASNGAGLTASQTFTLTVTQPPSITSYASTTFVVGSAGSFTVTASGSPAPSFSATGLPGWATLNASSGVISGTPPSVSGAPYAVTLVATNGVGVSATQSFTLNVSQAPAIISDNNTTFGVGVASSFAVLATGTPAPTFSATGLPSWATLNATTGVLSGTPTNVSGSPFTVVITAGNGVGANAMQTFTLSVTATLPVSHLVNISVRANSSAADPLTVGFSVSGGPRTVLVRGIGPSLKAFLVPTAVDDTILNLFQTVNNAPSLVATNDNWSTSNVAALQAAFATTYAFSIAVDSKDSALLATVEGSRTAQSYDATKSGIVLIEVYDTLTNEAGHLVNVSARNYAGTGSDVLTAGFSIQGTAPMTLLIRAVGSELTTYGVGGVLANPMLELYQTVGSVSTLIGSNDDWDSADVTAKQAAFAKTYAFALTAGSKSSCMIVTLQPGLYTAQLKGVNSTTGVGLLEVYVIP